jgi:hypothetical protein
MKWNYEYLFYLYHLFTTQNKINKLKNNRENNFSCCCCFWLKKYFYKIRIHYVCCNLLNITMLVYVYKYKYETKNVIVIVGNRMNDIKKNKVFSICR